MPTLAYLLYARFTPFHTDLLTDSVEIPQICLQKGDLLCVPCVLGFQGAKREEEEFVSSSISEVSQFGASAGHSVQHRKTCSSVSRRHTRIVGVSIATATLGCVAM